MKKTLTQQLKEAQQQIATLTGERDSARSAHSMAVSDIRIIRQNKDAEITRLRKEIDDERTIHKATLDQLGVANALVADLNGRIDLLAKPMKVSDGVSTATITTDLKLGTRSGTITVALGEPEGTKAALEAADKKAMESTRKALPLMFGKLGGGDLGAILAGAMMGGMSLGMGGGSTNDKAECNCPDCMTERNGG